MQSHSKSMHNSNKPSHLRITDSLVQHPCPPAGIPQANSKPKGPDILSADPIFQTSFNINTLPVLGPIIPNLLIRNTMQSLRLHTIPRMAAGISPTASQSPGIAIPAFVVALLKKKRQSAEVHGGANSGTYDSYFLKSGVRNVSLGVRGVEGDGFVDRERCVSCWKTASCCREGEGYGK